MDYRTYVRLFILLLAGVAATPGQTQCLDWLSPNSTTGWNNFNGTFGGAPCDDGTGCPIYQIESFQVWASEAYLVNNFIAGGEYAFSICNGPGAGSWVPDFTIIAPSGAIDAFGPGDGDSCTISWTATESGTYYIVINEEGECGGGTNTATDNGYPALTCIANAACTPDVTACNAGEIVTEGPITICGDEMRFDIMVDLDTVPTGGGVGLNFRNDLGGTGGGADIFTYTYPTLNASFDNDLNGFLSSNGLQPLSGTWIIRSVVYSDASDVGNSICSRSTDSLIVTFGSELVLDQIEDMGDGSAEVAVLGGSPPYTYLWDDANAQTTAVATALADGDYTVTVTDGIGCTLEATVTVITTAVNDIESLKYLSLFPNPTTGRFVLNFALNGHYDMELEIIDIRGQKVVTQSWNTSGERVDFDLSNQASGIYFLRIKVEGQVINRRIVVTKH